MLGRLAIPKTLQIVGKILTLGPEAPRVAAMKKLNLVHRGKCRGFFVKLFAAIFPGN